MYRLDETDQTPIIDLGNGYTVRLERDELDEATQLKALTELRETEEVKKAAIKEFTLLLSGKIKEKEMRTKISLRINWINTFT